MISVQCSERYIEIGEIKMSELRFKFCRSGDSKYFSHLDMMRMFQRAFRRAEIPVAYSQGFNPHPEFVIGMPLSVGVESDCEYVDIKLEEPVEDFVGKMNKALPENIRVLETKEKTGKKNIMAEIRAMICSIEYEQMLPGADEECAARMAKLFEEEAFTITKAVKPKKKRGRNRGGNSTENEVREVDVKELLYYVAFNGKVLYKADVYDESVQQKIEECADALSDSEYAGRFLVFAAAGSKGNVNARIICDAILEKVGMEYDGSCRMRRLETFVADGDRFVSPMSMIALA